MITVQLQKAALTGGNRRPAIILGLKSTKTNSAPAAEYFITAHIATRVDNRTDHSYTYSQEAVWTHKTDPSYGPNVLEIYETHKDLILAKCESLIC